MHLAAAGPDTPLPQFGNRVHPVLACAAAGLARGPVGKGQARVDLSEPAVALPGEDDAGVLPRALPPHGHQNGARIARTCCPIFRPRKEIVSRAATDDRAEHLKGSNEVRRLQPQMDKRTQRGSAGAVMSAKSWPQSCKGRSKTVARGGRGNFVALWDKRSRSFGWNSSFRSGRLQPSGWDGRAEPRRRESDRSVYGHGTVDRRSTSGVG